MLVSNNQKIKIMKNSKEEIDELIKNALTKEEAIFYDQLEEQSLLDMAMGVYHGKLKWFAVLTAVIMIIVFGLAVYCLVQFLQSEDTKEMILWASGMFGAMMTASMLKLFHWMQMDKNAILRELKRVEFQVGLLAKKIADTK